MTEPQTPPVLPPDMLAIRHRQLGHIHTPACLAGLQAAAKANWEKHFAQRHPEPAPKGDETR